MSASRFSVNLLGPAELRDNLVGSRVAFPAKGFLLVAYLVLESAGRPTARDRIAQLLWERGEPDKASANLRALLARIRRIEREAGFRLLIADRDHVALVPGVRSDIGMLLEIDARSASDIGELCSLYRGDLLEDASADSELSGIVLVHRARIRDILVRIARQFIESNQSIEDPADVERAAHKLIAIDPYQEAPYGALMRTYAGAGRLQDLDRAYRDYCHRFEKRPGAIPNATIMRLYRELRGPDTGAPSSHRDDWSTSSGSRAASQTTEPPRQPSSAPPRVCILVPRPYPDRRLHTIAAALLEDVTINLCNQRTFTLIAPYTSWQLDSERAEAAFVENYRIDFVVDSRIQGEGERLYLSVMLLDARTRAIAWADRFLIASEELAEAYHVISGRIARSLTAAVEDAELDRHRRNPEASAYVAYLVGIRSLMKMNLPEVRAARRLFKSSMRQDRSFAPAFSGFAHTLVLEWLLLARGETELLEVAEEYSRMAIAIDPHAAEGLREFGLCSLYRARFDDSLQSFAQAERQAPQYADLIADHADALSLSGMPSAAREKIQHAISLNPLCPDSYHWYLGTILYQLEDYQAAVNSLSRMRDTSPAHRLMAASLAMAGERSKAREYTKKVLRMYPDFSVDKWLAMIPIRETRLKEHYKEGLRAAGL